MYGCTPKSNLESAGRINPLLVLSFFVLSQVCAGMDSDVAAGEPVIH